MTFPIDDLICKTCYDNAFGIYAKDKSISIEQLFKDGLATYGRIDLAHRFKEFDVRDNLAVVLNDENTLYNSSEIIFVENPDTLSRFGWMENITIESIKESSLIQSTILKQPVAKEAIERTLVETRAILGHCNCPNQWELTENLPYRSLHDAPYWEHEESGKFYCNKQGLVYGMVQSGKTFSMLSLNALAFQQGYNLVIHLSSDKDSLRTQTQNRVNDFFQLVHGHNRENKIHSLTNAQDYSEATRDVDVLEKYQYLRDSGKIILVVKKNNHVLKRVLDDLTYLNQEIYQIGLSKNDLKVLIIDDEADYATQNTSTQSRAPINNTLTQIRQILSQNTYVAYTATPQACFGANPNEIVGYPKDFIIPISPVKDNNGVNLSYTGLEEFYDNPSLRLNKVIPDEAWPYHKKNGEGKGLGIYDPVSGDIVKDKLVEIERLHIKNLILNIDSKSVNIFIEASINFLLSTSILWFRHQRQHQISLESNLESYIQIISDRKTRLTGKAATSRKEEFPYSAMMVNMAYYTDMQMEIKKFFELIRSKIKEIIKHCDFRDSDADNVIIHLYKLQIEKSNYIEKHVPGLQELELFFKAAFYITFIKNIYETQESIYILNSTDEGNTLKYEAVDVNVRPKVSSLMIGGLLLGRGLTIQNLIVSVFLRSQASTMSDTSLQMCRWFGHKRKIIDLITVYSQRHSLSLFQEISLCDKYLRESVYQGFNSGLKGPCMLIELRNSPLFRLTSPRKSKFFEQVVGNSYSGKSKFYKSLKKVPNYFENNFILLDYLKSNASKDQGKAHNRAFVLKFFSFSDVKSLLNRLKLAPQEESGFNLLDIYNYITLCEEEGINYDFSLGFFGVDMVQGAFKSVPLNRALDPEFNVKKFVGGETSDDRRSYFAGDNFIDIDNHVSLKNQFLLTGKRTRDSQMNILINFYFLDVNYITKDQVLSPGDKDYAEENCSIAIAVNFPEGGLKYSLSTNKLVKAGVVNAECHEEV
jgi:hypothetical protein